MTNTKIWKYQLGVVDEQILWMPPGTECLTVAEQGTNLCIWAKVTLTGESLVGYLVQIVGTGNPVPQEVGRYLGSVVTRSSPVGYVWHVFVKEP